MITTGTLARRWMAHPNRIERTPIPAAKSATPRVTKNHTREFGSNRGADASHVRTDATRARRARMQSAGDSVVREWHCVIEV